MASKVTEVVEQLEATRNEEVEAELQAVFGLPETVEFMEPYKGKHGQFPAEIYISGYSNLQEVYQMFCEIKQEADIIADNLGMRGGIVQIIIKTEAAKTVFLNALKEKYEKSTQGIIANLSTPARSNTNSASNDSWGGWGSLDQDLRSALDDVLAGIRKGNASSTTSSITSATAGSSEAGSSMLLSSSSNLTTTNQNNSGNNSNSAINTATATVSQVGFKST